MIISTSTHLLSDVLLKLFIWHPKISPPKRVKSKNWMAVQIGGAVYNAYLQTLSSSRLKTTGMECLFLFQNLIEICM